MDAFPAIPTTGTTLDGRNVECGAGAHLVPADAIAATWAGAPACLSCAYLAHHAGATDLTWHGPTPDERTGRLLASRSAIARADFTVQVASAFPSYGIVKHATTAIRPSEADRDDVAIDEMRFLALAPAAVDHLLAEVAALRALLADARLEANRTALLAS